MITFSTFILLALPTLYLVRKFFNSPLTRENRNVKGEVVIVTGSSAGIGLEAAKALLLRGAIVIFACRNEEKTNKVIESLIKSKELEQRCVFMKLDVSDVNSVRSFVKEVKSKYEKVDMLINNAGGLNESFIRSAQDFEKTFATNLIGNIFLINLLRDYFSKNGRIVNVSSAAYSFYKFDQENYQQDLDEKLEMPQNYQSFRTYCLSKLALNMFTRHFAEFIQKKEINIKIACLHPGAVVTSASNAFTKWYYRVIFIIAYPVMWFFFKDAYVGAQTTLHLALINYERLSNGGYYEDCKEKRMTAFAEEKKTERLILKYIGAKIDGKLKRSDIDDKIAEYIETISK